MTTVDNLLLQIVNHSSPTIEEILTTRDARVLRSLSTAVTTHTFITENQSKLLLKIIIEHIEKIRILVEDVEDIIKTPIWSKSFRVVESYKKLYISQSSENLHINIEFTFSSSLRNTISALQKQISGLVQVHPGKLYQADLTENNIVELISALEPLGFEIEEKLENYYKIIKSWSENEIKDQYKIDTIIYPNFQKVITADLGIETAIDTNIINDRSIRYQYFTEKSPKKPENLTEVLANRTSTRCWANRKEINLIDILESLEKLKRFPLMVIFDIADPEKCLEELKNLNQSLEKFGIFESVGIYFRLSNIGTGKDFNQLIATKSYNCQLDSDTKIIGVANGKIPKFLLKTPWRPMSVISIGKILQNNKTSTYTNKCDLIINWTDNEPIIETRATWE